MRRLILLVAFSSWFACQANEMGMVEQPIKGSNTLDLYDYLCTMKITLPPDIPSESNPRDETFCTCSHVAPGIVLTAASCVWHNVEEEMVDQIDVRFGPVFDDSVDQFTIDSVVMHRYYDPERAGQHDLALLKLNAEPAYPLVTLSDRALTTDDVPETGTECLTADTAGCVTLAGYGKTATGEAVTDWGTQRALITALTAVADESITVGNVDEQSCEGDGGGPSLMDFGAGPVQVAVTEMQWSCYSGVKRTKVAPYLDSFIYAYIDIFGATCGADDNCETSCPRTPDPDCDICSWSADPDNCSEDCPTRDWDCPDLGSFVGDACEKSGDCEEGGRCVEADDDATFTFCTLPCDPAELNPCRGMEMTCDTSDSDGECVWNVPSPGSQGFTCGTDNMLCRSGICEETICVNECDPAGDPCPEPYNCGPSTVQPGTNVCLGDQVSGGGGFCAPSSIAGASGSGKNRTGWGALVLLGLVLASVVRLRRRQ